MTSHDQDRLVSAAVEPLPGTDSTLTPPRGRSRGTGGGGAHRAPSSVPRQRRAKAESTGTGEVQRPTPHRRTRSTTVAPATPVLAPAVPAPAEPVEVDPAVVATSEDAAAVVAAVAEGRLRARARRLPSVRRRPALYLAAALVGAMGVTVVSAGEPNAHAGTSAGHSVSIAARLGVHALPQTVTTADARALGELAASRNERSSEQAAAAYAQASAARKAIAAAQAAARPKAVLPVNGARLTSTFGMRWGVLHAGIDLAAPLGTPEYAAMDGVVLRAGPASGFGLAVYIQHANGDVTVYGHMEQILVSEGQVVRAGQTIALLGQNGQATGPHLHFEVHVGGMMGPKIDPIPWLRARGVSI